MFPDGSLPTPTNGGFENQEAFRKFVMKHQNGKWQTEFTARPTLDIQHDYNDDTLGDAFPLQFPYGHTGLKGDPAVTERKKNPSENESTYSGNCFGTESRVSTTLFSI